MEKIIRSAAAFALLLTLCSPLGTACAQGTAFTYQGRLNSGAGPATGIYDFSFSLYNVASGGSAVTGPVTVSATGVTNGLFLATLDFGAGWFTGNNYWLDISVRTNGAGSFTELTPRQPLTPAPYAIMANSASNLLGTLPATQLGAGTAAVNVSGNAAGFTGSLSGDVTGPQSATVVSKVGGVTAANVASGANAANAATPVNTVAAIMKRDAGGSFAAQSATLSGNLTLPATSAIVGSIYSGSSTVFHVFGNQNLFAGVSAGNLTMSGQFDTGLGFYALAANTTGTSDTGVGDGALYNNTIGNQNTAVGTIALGLNTTGTDNTAVGYVALFANTTGSKNTALGTSALQANTNGTYNLALGWHALNASVTGSFNVAVGEEAMYSSTNSGFNVAVGGEAMYDNTTGGADTAVGDQALYNSTSGSYNTAIGNQALFSSTTSSQNTALGSGAMFSDITGFDNVAAGYSALGNNTNGNYNLASGWNALGANTSGSFNVACGGESLIDNTSGGMNVACGEEALYFVTTGSGNTGLGNQALFSCTGNFNIAVGNEAGISLTTGDNNIDISNVGNAGEANTTRIGTQGTQTRAFIAGISGTTAASGVAVYVNSSGQLGTLTSSKRFKDDIQTMGDSSDVLLSLRPVTFRYKPEIDPDRIPQFGLVAEEVNAVDPDLVARDEHGKINTVRYEAVNAMLLNEFLKQHKTVETQSAQIDDLKSQLAELKQMVQSLAARK